MSSESKKFKAKYDIKTSLNTANFLTFLNSKVDLSSKPGLTTDITEKMLECFDDIGLFIQDHISEQSNLNSNSNSITIKKKKETIKKRKKQKKLESKSDNHPKQKTFKIEDLKIEKNSSKNVNVENINKPPKPLKSIEKLIKLKNNLHLINNNSTECPECGKLLGINSLKYHINSHLGIKTFKCKHNGCNKSFTWPSNKNIHEKICKKIKNPLKKLKWKDLTKYNKCKICNKNVRKDYFKNHMDSHNGIKSYTCKYKLCNRKFTWRQSKIAHETKCKFKN